MGLLMTRFVIYPLQGVVLLALVLSACSHLKLDRTITSGEGDWPTYARDASRVNMTPESLDPPLALAWSADLTGGVGNGSPVLVDSLLIIGTLRGELYAFDVRNGKRLGWLSFGEAIQGSPVVRGRVVYVAVSNTTESLVAYDMSAGKKLWTGRYGDIEVSPLLTGDRLYIGNTTGEFYCVDAERGDELWTFSIPKNTRLKGIRSSAAMGGSTVIFGGDDGFVYGLHGATGELLWSYDTGFPVIASPCIVERTAYVGNTGGQMFAIGTEDGEPRWTADLGSPVQAGSAVSGDMILTATAAGKLFALNRSTGELLWSNDLGSVIGASPVVAGSYVYVGTLRKNLFALSVQTGEIVFQEVVEGRIKTSPAVGFGRLFVASDERWILAFEERRAE
jgi:outer membrane protein assembly factor BamB